MGSFVIVQSQDFRAGQTLQFCADSTINIYKRSGIIDCFIGLGGNIGDTFEVMCKTLGHISRMDGVNNLLVSRPFITTPVSPIPQPHFLNAVLSLQTDLSPHALFEKLQAIELLMGKTKKLKSAPRVIDIDLLFYGAREMSDPNLTLPHPSWHKRLFVLLPLADIATYAPTVKNQSLKSLIHSFKNLHNERVIPHTKALVII